MNRTYLTGTETGIKALALAAFPGYNGRKFAFKATESVELHDMDWSGGTHSDYAGVNLATRQAIAVPDLHLPRTTPTVALHQGLAIVEHRRFCGKDMGIVFHVHPTDAPQMLPPAVEATDDEKIVLAFTGALKNTYSGRKNIRLTEAHRAYRITADRWVAAQDSLKARKLLTKSGAITPDGRNVDTTPYRT